MFDHQRIILSDYDYKSRHNELLREAEHMRLVKQVRMSDVPQNRLYKKVLSSVGHQLVSWGQRLEQLENSSRTMLALEEPDCSH